MRPAGRVLMAFFHRFLARSVAATRRIFVGVSVRHSFFGCVSFFVCSYVIVCASLLTGHATDCASVLSGHATFCEICCRVIYGTLSCFSSQVFFAQHSLGHAEHAHSVRRWCWSAAVCPTGGGCQSNGAVHRRHVFCSHGHVSGHVVSGVFPDALIGESVSVNSIHAMDRSVEELGPDSPAWWRRGQPMQLTMATVAEHVVLQVAIAMPAVDEHVLVEKSIANVEAEVVGDEPACSWRCSWRP